MQDYSKITQLTTVVIERASFLEFLSGRKFLWEFLWQVLPARRLKGEDTSQHALALWNLQIYPSISYCVKIHKYSGSF